MEKRFAVLIALTPALSLVLSAVYFSAFFSHFPGFSTKILSIGDYLDHAVGHFTYMLIAFGGIWLVALSARATLYAQKENETKVDYDHRMQKAYKHSRRFIIGCFAVLLAYYIIAHLFLAPSQARLGNYVWFFWVAWALPDFQKYLKGGDTKISIEVLYSVLVFVYFAITTFNHAHSLADKIQAEATIAEETTHLFFDSIESGYIYVNDRKLVLEDRSLGIVIESDIRPPEKRNGLCRTGVRFLCP